MEKPIELNFRYEQCHSVTSQDFSGFPVFANFFFFKNHLFLLIFFFLIASVFDVKLSRC